MAEIIIEVVVLTYSVKSAGFSKYFFPNKTQQRNRGEPETSSGFSVLSDDGVLSNGMCGRLIHTDPRDSGL